ncbi:MAG: beta-hydroxyacyl-ACP dehydratase [Thermoguttaceae bacterium]|nr:beta-hydroxyacyl-ACP dehydratase [Thermoguttaceae bacterium]
MADDNNVTKNESFFDSRAAILAAIPHRPPFLFIDEIVTWTDDEIVCAYRFKQNEFFFAGHYPGFPIVPGVVLCESAMQAGAIYMTRLFSDEDRKAGKVPVVGRMNDVKFKQLVRPGDRVEQRVSLKEKIAGVYMLRAKVTVEGKTVVTFDFAVTMADRPSDE